MTYERREEILSKDALGAKDISELLDISLSAAYKVIRNIKLEVGDRLKISGRVLTEEYIAYFHVNAAERYSHRLTDRDTDYGAAAKKEDTARRWFSVNDPRGRVREC